MARTAQVDVVRVSANNEIVFFSDGTGLHFSWFGGVIPSVDEIWELTFDDDEVVAKIRYII